MNEKDLWQMVRKNIPGHLIRIENLVTRGVPDVHACHNGKHVWLELKIGSGNTVYFQNSQIAFFHEAKKHKEPVKIFMRKNELLYLIDSTIFINSVYKPIKGDRVAFNINELSKAFIWGQPWKWKDIAQRIYE